METSISPVSSTWFAMTITNTAIEMHLRSTANQVVSIGSASIGFREGETIWTESSYKFRCEDVRRLAAKAGFRCVTQWVDEEWPFAQSLLRAI